MKTLSILIISLSIGVTNSYAQPSSLDSAQVVVTVNDFKGKGRPNDIVIFQGKSTGKSFKGITNSQGVFEIHLPKGDSFLIKIQGLGETKDFHMLVVPNVKGRLAKSQIVLQYEHPKSITLTNVFYASGKATLQNSSFKSLDELAEVMIIKTNIQIEIAGHTDAIGNDIDNQKLSQSRSESVKNYLINKGIASYRIVAKGYGESYPIASNEDESSRSKNRRTEIIIIQQ